MKLVKYLISMPKTILFNFKVFPFKVARKLPVLIAYNVKIHNIYRDCIIINREISRFMIKINFGNGSDGVNYSYKKTGYIDVREKARIIFNGKADFSSGVSIRVDHGDLTFGNNFSCNKTCFFSCSKEVTIGNDVLLGWSINIRDSDGHTISNLNDIDIVQKTCKPVVIGNHVWLASKVDILKGTIIPDDCIVGYNSCVTRKFVEKNCIISGYPAKIIKKDVNWQN
ncbi:acyltransferase [Clostridium algoriphilum]|uniref:acyltransferase n=1 Tax=Clostridium algoriphilum TaxID=198347 RepID=UPI001CF538DA|nr:acyltransferase [Clostridium algoriphilum]MCB2295311.1 acyltransferase [Clostridium algoriphilum]